jgi:subtilase family serine protease
LTCAHAIALSISPRREFASSPPAFGATALSLVNQGVIYDPPTIPFGNPGGILGGSLGGPSEFFAKPWFQKGVPGTHRQVPDISWLADPYTGGVIVVSQPTQLPLQIWYPVGGTELATPMFSALWAIANQEAGVPLGQAAPYLYSMPSTTITDIVPYTSPNNVTATIEDSSTVTHHYNPSQTLLLNPYFVFGEFYSAIWDQYTGNENIAWVLSFGQDYNNHPEVGWDVPTGLGTPNPKPFADWFAPVRKK